MEPSTDIKLIREKISMLRKTIEELTPLGREYPCLLKNTNRMSASLKMLELDFPDLMDRG